MLDADNSILHSNTDRRRKIFHWWIVRVVLVTAFGFLLPPANEVCKGYVFTMVCQSFCSQVGPPGPQPGGDVEGSDRGGSPGPHLGGLQAHTQGGLQAHTWGCIPACTEAATPPNRRVLLRAVRILLECILVSFFIKHFIFIGGP